MKRMQTEEVEDFNDDLLDDSMELRESNIKIDLSKNSP
jgi:hypothetical protein